MQDRCEFAIEKAEIGDRNIDVARVVVTDEKGCRAIAFLNVRLVRGRAKFTLTTKKHRGQETITGAVADWVI